MTGSGGSVVLGLLVVSALLSGCSGGSATVAPEDADASSTRVVDPNATATGIVRGTIVDDEESPLSGAQVALQQLKAEVTTGSDGRFEFTKVPQGRYFLLATKLGYNTTTRLVELFDAGPLELLVPLEKLEFVEPYFKGENHRLIHHFGQAHVDWALDLFDQAPFCEGCRWDVNYTSPPQNLLLEVTGKHAIANPRTDSEHIYVYIKKPGESDYDIIYNNGVTLPVRLAFNATQIQGASQFRFLVICEIEWVCFEEQREAWVTAFFHMDVPEGFTLLPPA